MRAHRLAIILIGLVSLGAAAAPAAKKPPLRPPFSVVEATIPELQAALGERRVTSRELVLQYLSRIALYEDRLNAVMGAHGIEEAMKTHTLDVLLFPGSSGASIAARPGYPAVIVPFGLVPNAPTPPFPEAFTAKSAPYGVSFTGLSCSEPRLLALAYAFEQATKRRVPPATAP